MNPFYRALFINTILLLLFGIGVLSYTQTPDFSFLWFIGMIAIILCILINLHIVRKFVDWQDAQAHKEVVKE